MSGGCVTDLPDVQIASDANPAEQLLWTLHRIGGAERWVDVEELYLAAYQAWPARYGWRTRPDLPDYKKCAKALQDLEDPKRSALSGFTLKDGRYLRRLSPHGLNWCERHAEALSARYGAVLGSAQRQDDGRLLKDLVASEAFARHGRDEGAELDLWVLAEAFRCLPDSPKSTWGARFADARRAARRNERDDVERFIDRAEQRINEGRD